MGHRKPAIILLRNLFSQDFLLCGAAGGQLIFSCESSGQGVSDFRIPVFPAVDTPLFSVVPQQPE